MDTPLIYNVTEADSTVIWLHGLGATKGDFAPVAEILQREVLPNTRFILPQAPVRPVTLNGGMPMPSWYDIIDLSSPRQINQAELDHSSQSVITLIEAERKAGIPLERIILAGFSQGGAVVLHTAFIAYHEEVGGVMALSTYGPTFEDGVTLNEKKSKIPTLHLHGTADPVVLPQFGRAAYQFLSERGINAKWHEYPMQHEVIQPEIADIARWLMAQLKD